VSSVSYGSENLFLYFEGTTHIKSARRGEVSKQSTILHNVDLNYLYTPHGIVKAVKSKWLHRAGNAFRMEAIGMHTAFWK
jgi:hypothetical protein